jgi:RHS repeat-associated protein
MNARYYLPEVGRFISPDTFVPDPGNPQSHNRYAYVLNSPVNYTDPSGHL